MSILFFFSVASASVPTVHDVLVTDTGFDPPLVEITEGDSVRWVFLGSVPQSSTSSAGQAESWDSGLLQPNLFFEIRLSIPGHYNYYDQTFGADDGMGGAVGVSGEILVLPDTDGDGLSNQDEIALGTNPNKIDSDKDGLDDWDEVVVRFSDPLDLDSDNDGLTDSEDVDAGASPIDDDTDDDGLDDFQEVVVHGTEPFLADTDLGGVDDGVEVANGTDPLNPNDDGLAGPPHLVLVGAPTANGVNTFAASNFAPNGSLKLLLSPNLGNFVIASCNLTTDLAAKPRIVANHQVDANGDATFQVTIHKPGFVGSFHLQAFDPTTCLLSDVVTVTLP
jgi:plastocyanin